MPTIELTFKLSISEESLKSLRAAQEDGSFDLDYALSLLQDSLPAVDIVHVEDDN